MSAINDLIEILKDNKAGISKGIYSVCSAHPEVIRASLKQASKDGSIVLIESTSNQVDQFGGYTGMIPSQFASYIRTLAAEMNFPFERILLGGDHLGPNAWQSLPAEEAMAHARTLIEEYVKAGYLKIHLDASMYCADDEGDRHKPLSDEIVASRAAELCEVAEQSWKKFRNAGPKPIYIIGTEVPIPGGAQEQEDSVSPTLPKDAIATIEITRKAFFKKGLKEDVWNRVVALVVQPGVEFGDDQVFHYDNESAKALSHSIEGIPQIIFEVHSTDYQSEPGLTQLVADHYCILKVGPWLTFAYREALFALEQMECELYFGSKKTLSSLRDTVEKVMLEHPKYWKRYYSGSPEEQAFKRMYSFSDRSRYYWPDERLVQSTNILIRNIDEKGIPLSMLSQYIPNQFKAVQEGRIKPTAKDLIHDRIQDVLRQYASACGYMQ